MCASQRRVASEPTPQGVGLAPHFRAGFGFAAQAVILAALLPLPLRAADPNASLAGEAPADVGLFVEARDAEDLLVPLTEPQLWTALAELVGQPARAEDARAWRDQIKHTIGIEPVNAIKMFFARRVAFVAESAGRAQDAVVLCRPAPQFKPEQWVLRIWEGQSEPGSANPTVYRLKSNIGFAEGPGFVMFGDLQPADGLFRRMTRFVGQQNPPSLAGDPTFKDLLRRVPSDPDGVLFARLQRPGSTAPASAPAGSPLRGAFVELPGPLRGASAVLIGLHRKNRLLQFTAVGNAPAAARPSIAATAGGSAAPAALLGRLPRRTLAAWEGWVDYPALLAGVSNLPPTNALRLALQLHQQTGAIQRLTSAFGPRTAAAVGVVTSGERAAGAPPPPAIALLISLRDEAAAESEMHDLMDDSARKIALLALAAGKPAVAQPRSFEIEDLTAWQLDLTGLLPEALATALGPLHVAWAVDGDVLIVASHQDWLRQILRARWGRGETLGALVALQPRPPTSDCETLIALESGPIADLGQLWLEYLEKAAPHLLDEQWWRRWQPGGDVRLGIDVEAAGDGRRLKVVEVRPGSPSDGLLELDDLVLGVSSQRFATTQPADEVRRGLETRPHARWIDLLIERDGALLVRRVPLPFVDPVQALRRLVAVGRIAQQLVYSDDVPASGAARGFLTVELRQGDEPLYDFRTAPASRPASAPATQTRSRP